MPEEVYTDCPSCEREIPFYETVDDLKECPECGTKKDRLFDLADPPLGESMAVAATDGGQDDV